MLFDHCPARFSGRSIRAEFAQSASCELPVISRSAGHAHHAFCSFMARAARFFKARSSVEAIAPNGFARRRSPERGPSTPSKVGSPFTKRVRRPRPSAKPCKAENASMGGERRDGSVVETQAPRFPFCASFIACFSLSLRVLALESILALGCELKPDCFGSCFTG